MSSDTVDKQNPGARGWLAQRWAAFHGWQARQHIQAEHRPGSGRRAALVTGAVFLALALLVAFIVSIWDWNWFRAPMARFASARMHREVTISGNLNVHLWSWNPTATVDGVHVANPAWAGPSPMADVGRIAVRIRLIPLLTGQLDLRRLEFDNPRVNLLRDAQGRTTWDFSNGQKTSPPLRLPPIRNFIINNGQLQVRDEIRKLTFNGTIDAHEQLGAQTRGFEMTGQGALNAQPFHLEVTGGPLLNIDRNKPYPFNADIRAGQTYVTAKGAVPKPFDFGHFYMDTTARGPDLADLYGLTGVPLPNTPPYSLHARLARNDHIYRLDGIGGRVGSSDLAGEIEVDASRPRTMLQADLRTQNLNFPDLGALFGGAPKAGPVASASQKVVAQHLAAENRIFPDTTLNTRKIRSIDADVTYKAVSIRNAPINLTSGSTRVKLNDGLLRAEPLALGLPQGKISGYVQLDARKPTPATDIDLRLSNARLESLFPFKFQGGSPFAGAVVGRAQLKGSGDSVHKAFANADGQVMVVSPGGEIRQSIAELMGVDVIKGLGLLNSNSKQTTPIRCAVANFQARKGVLTATHLVFDTEPVLVSGTGQINLDTERLAFRAQGHPKKFQLVRLLVPVDVEGPIRSPSLRVEKGQAFAQGGIAVALATALSPLAILLPFVDPGLAKDANCASMLADDAHKGAPVKSAPVKSAPLRTASR
ncbi:AsmA family protein [Phenylobacterium sp.]|uniref:AsmA family protein n=1 Tax=Phenylobacterium sp. TaxID=1871053 RepID=UPI002DF529BC|nr:AsmA family protein [Phenylobacterium sp.]